MSNSIGLILMAGGDAGAHPLLAAMRQVRQACTRDQLQRAIDSGQFDPVIVATDDPEWVAAVGALPVSIDLDAPDRPFHFGRRLSDLIAHYHLDRVFYLGAAAAPLFSVDHFRQIADAARAHDHAVIANNIHSTDWAAIAPASIVEAWIDRLENDNALGWVLSNDAGLEPIAWPSSPAARLDIDVPIDAQIAALHPACGLHLRQIVTDLQWDDARLRAARDVLRTKAARITLIGRVPSWALAQVEQSTQVWTRVYSEERGMRAAGRLQSGGVRSILSDHLKAVGLQQLIHDLSAMTDAILWDTRVLWAAQGLWPNVIDRYASDLGMVDHVGDPFIRDFTRAVLDAPVPIVTGGHALVSGGLWALLESMKE